MSKFRTIKNSLLGGEISPTAFGRTDLPQYAAALKTLRNMIPFLSGGAYRRPGTLYEADESASTFLAPLLIPHYSDTFDTFTVSNHAYCHAILNPITSAPLTMDSFTPDHGNKSPATQQTTTAAGPYGLQAQLPPADPFGTNTRSDIYLDPLLSWQFAQSGDVIFVAGYTNIPQKIARVQSAISGSGGYTTGSFTLSDYNSGITDPGDISESIPFLTQNTTPITLQPDAFPVATQLTASAAFFNAGHVGGYFKINHAGTIGLARVTGWVSSTVVNVSTVKNFGAATAVTTWWEGAWSTYRGFPRTVAFFQDRLCFGGTRFQPDTIWFSQKGRYTRFSHEVIVSPYDGPGLTDTDPFTMDLISRDLAEINFMSAGKTLFIGTLQAEHVLGVGTDGTFNHGSFLLSKETDYGSAYVQAARAGSEILCVDKSGTKVRAITFNNDEQSYVTEELQVLFDDYPKYAEGTSVFENPAARAIRQVRWDKSRSVLWCVDTAGDLFGLSRDRRLAVNAWHTHQLGGFNSAVRAAPVTYAVGHLTFDPTYTNPTGSIVSIAVVPNPSLGTDDLWLCVRRFVNSQWGYFFERMIGEHTRDRSAYLPPRVGMGNFYTDSTGFDSTPLSAPETLAGIPHLEGIAPVGIGQNANGIFVVSGSTVTAGVSTLQLPYPGGYVWNVAGTVFWMGLPFDSLVELPRIEAGSQVGSAQGAIKRIHDVHLRFFKTLSCKVGRDANNLETINFRDAQTLMIRSAELYTGDKRVKLDADCDRDGIVYILQDKPLPFAVMSIIMEGQTYDG